MAAAHLLELGSAGELELCQQIPHMLDGIPGPTHSLNLVPCPVAAAWIADAVPMIPVRVLHWCSMQGSAHDRQWKDWNVAVRLCPGSLLLWLCCVYAVCMHAHWCMHESYWPNVLSLQHAAVNGCILLLFLGAEAWQIRVSTGKASSRHLPCHIAMQLMACAYHAVPTLHDCFASATDAIQ